MVCLQNVSLSTRIEDQVDSVFIYSKPPEEIDSYNPNVYLDSLSNQDDMNKLIKSVMKMREDD